MAATLCLASIPMRPDESRLREIIAALAPIERPPGSEGEREAAEWIAARLHELGADARVETERAHPTFHWPIGLLSAVGAAAGVAALRWRRAVGAIGGLLAGAGIADDVQGGPHVLRRALRQSPIHNVVAELGDPDAERTVVLMAHHDVARCSPIFDQTLQRKAWERWPERVQAIDRSVPIWWSVAGAPLLVGAGALLGRRGLTAFGSLFCAGTAAVMADMARRPPSPGANDNLSGVAALITVMEAFVADPVPGVRLLAVSAGAEESLQEGIRGFARRHFAGLPRERTWFVNFESIGSPELCLLEGEGPLWMEDYEPAFREFAARQAAEHGIAVRRNQRSSYSTDSVVPARAGFPIATLVSLNEWKNISNYHSLQDTPDRIDYGTVADAAELGTHIVRALAADRAAEPVAG